MPVASLPTIELWYERSGSGQPLLYISGTGGDLRTRPSVLEGPLPKAFDVLAYDQRGMGRSDKPDIPYSMADYGDDAAALLQAVGWDSAHVIGVSFGGMVAQELALRHPGRVKKLVLVCTSPGGAGGASFPFHEIQHLTGEERAQRLIPVMDTRQDEAWKAAHPDAWRQMLLMMSADPFADEPGRKTGARRQLEARAKHDVWDRLPQLRCPTLIAAGRHDGIALPATQQRMADRIRHSQLRFFEGGHLFLMQDPEALPAIIDFLNG